MSDEPIDERPFLSGVTVINIEDLRVSRGMTRRPVSACRHRSVSYDDKERRVWCRDCEKDIDPFDAFILLAKRHDAATKKLQQRESRIAEAEKFQLRTLAAKALDEAWRKRSMVPACPHCSGGLFPEHFKDGRFAMLGVDFAKARMKQK